MYISFIITWTILVFTSITQGAIPSDMLEMLDPSVDPCADFYQYSCGGWMKNKDLKPSDLQIDSSYGPIGRKNNKIIRELMNKNLPILGEYWDSCMNLEHLNALGNEPLQQDLSRIIYSRTKMDLLELVGEFSQIQSNVFLKYTVVGDEDGSPNSQLSITAADLILPSLSFYSESKFPTIEQQYRDYITSLMALSGFSTVPLDHSIADIVINVEKKIAEIKKIKFEKSSTVAYENAVKSPMLEMYFKGLRVLHNSAVTSNTIIRINPIIDHIEKLIESISVDDLRVYIAFVIVNTRAEWLGHDFTRLHFNFFGTTIYGLMQPETRESICINFIKQYFPDLIGTYYYQQAFDPEREKNALDMFYFIQNAMDRHLLKANWLTLETKQQARNKLSKLIPLIGQSRVPKSHAILLSRDHFYQNMIQILMIESKRVLHQVSYPFNRLEWQDSAAQANAQYHLWTNTVEFPAAVLQPPNFNGFNVHPARNFGAAGTLMGHEITHGFDAKGSTYDGEGNHLNWWSSLSSTIYWHRAHCIQNQYNSFVIHGNDGKILGKVNGKRTLNENIADQGGLTLAWDAYQEYMTRIQSTIQNVTQEEGNQMFFLAFSQRRCSKSRDQVLKQQLETDEHAPNEWRVNGAVMNNQHFAKVFNCQPMTPMNPSSKCPLL